MRYARHNIFRFLPSLLITNEAINDQNITSISNGAIFESLKIIDKIKLANTAIKLMKRRAYKNCIPQKPSKTPNNIKTIRL